ncbi:GAF domain-containing protein [Xylophilus sp. Kf1]|nr:GAF domain-containing protein [Xylophilus sp. Kf1]
MNDFVLPESPESALRSPSRLAAVRRLEFAEAPEAAFDGITRLAARLLGVPASFVSIVEDERDFYVSQVGFPAEIAQARELRGRSFCHFTLAGSGPLVITDTHSRPEWKAVPTVTSLGVRAYLGIPIRVEGENVGSLCVIDTAQREWSEEDIQSLTQLAASVEREIQLRVTTTVARKEASYSRSLVRSRARDESRNRQILDSATDFAIIATDLSGRVTRWNTGAERIFGWTGTEMLGQTVERIFTQEDRRAGRPDEEMKMALKSGHGNDERWHMKADGSRFWAQGKLTPLKSEQDAVTGFVKVLSDCTTARRNAERLKLLGKATAGLLSSDDPDRLMQDILLDGAEVLGYDQSYSYLVDGACSRMQLMFSTNTNEEIRAWLNDVSVAEVPLCGYVAHTREKLVLNDIENSTDPKTVISRKMGVRAYAGFPIFTDGKLQGVLSFFTMHRNAFDADALSFFESLARFLSIGRERLEREASLSDLAMTLEQRVDQRTKELLRSQEALRQSQKMDAVGQLTGGVAHDFNNLLTVIKGSVDLLRRTRSQPQRQERYIDAIASTTERAAKLTGQLLAFARRQTLRPEVFDVGQKLQGLTEMLRTIMGVRVTLDLELPGRQSFVHADVSQFETAVVNMCVNARDAMGEEGLLRLRLRGVGHMPSIRGHADVQAAFAAVSIQDDGSGIDADDVGKIFEPFFTTKEVGKGTGLGLSQVFGFAKQSGGDVDVTSVVGQGSTFTLFLPEVEPNHETAPKPSVVEGTDGTGIRVLAVEDNIEVGNFCVQALQDYGFDMVLCTSAESALDMLAAGHPFDVVFSDVVMPGMGGLELAKKLKASHPDLPVILASGYSHILAKEGSFGFEVIQKPYSAEVVGRTLVQAAGRR